MSTTSLSPGFVEPAYEDRSLGDVLPAVARALGVDAGLPPTSLVLPEARSYVVFLVDGLGYELLRDHPDQAPFLHSLLGEQPPATAGVPSTTATSLTSLGTALMPGSHGLVGFTRGSPAPTSCSTRCCGARPWTPREWQPHPTAFERLAAAGRGDHGREQARVRRLRADRSRGSGARSSSAPTSSASGWWRCWRPRAPSRR